jgi:hypothetical protein
MRFDDDEDPALAVTQPMFTVLEVTLEIASTWLTAPAVTGKTSCWPEAKVGFDRVIPLLLEASLSLNFSTKTNCAFNSIPHSIIASKNNGVLIS